MTSLIETYYQSCQVGDHDDHEDGGDDSKDDRDDDSKDDSGYTGSSSSSSSVRLQLYSSCDWFLSWSANLDLIDCNDRIQNSSCLRKQFLMMVWMEGLQITPQ